MQMKSRYSEEAPMELNTTLTLGSLFDGSGGFPLGGLLCGITPVWASEIEPFPIRVTTKRLPFMKHYGDISQMDGGKIEPVDIITFGSPCTDMSIAGRRAGLDGKQSVLFYQAIRIIQEMRDATHGKYPRYIVWENVPGAFSSNHGEDFKAVLEAVIGIKEPGAQVPMPEKNLWPYADLYMGEQWSVAYRTLDAQHWGVPQRRRRIFLVADFAGWGAGQVLFESEGLSGYSAEGFRAWQRAARDPAAGFGAAGICLNDQGGGKGPLIQKDKSATLGCNNDQALFEPVAFGISSDQSKAMLSSNPHAGIYKARTSRTLDTSGGNPGCNQGGIAVVYAMTTGSYAQVEKETSPTLMARDYKDPTAVNSGYTVRRLTPTECARLQGFPDWWCTGLETSEPTREDIAFWTEVWETHRRAVNPSVKPKTERQIVKWLKAPYSDAAEYKMWGNGVALPCVWFVLSGIVFSTQLSPA